MIEIFGSACAERYGGKGMDGRLLLPSCFPSNDCSLAC